MPTFGERLKYLRKSKGLSQVEMARRFGVGQSTVSSWEQNGKEPDHERLKDLADFFQVSLDYLLGRERQLGEDAAEYRFIRVPILGKIPAGAPFPAEEQILEWTRIPDEGKYREGEVFILVVEGDSMEGKSRICAGDRVLVKVQPDVESGEIAVVSVNGEDATLKRVKKLENGEVLLMPDNPKYDPILVRDGNARIIGKVVQVMFEPK